MIELEVDEGFIIVCHKRHIPTTQQYGHAIQSNPIINYFQPKHNAKWEDRENHVTKKNHIQFTEKNPRFDIKDSLMVDVIIDYPQFKQHFKFGEPKKIKIESYIHNPPTIVTTLEGALALDSHKIKVTTYEASPSLIKL